MKLRNTAIAVSLFFAPLAQPLMVVTGVALTSAALVLSAPERANAGNNLYCC